MKKTFLLLLVACCFLGSCNSGSNDTDKQKKEKKKTIKDDDETTAEDEESPAEDEDDGNSKKIKQMAAGICDCMGDAVEGLSTKSKNLLIKASNSSNPTQMLQTELMKIEDPEEKQRTAQEFVEFGKLAQSGDLQACATRLEKKYSVGNNDTKMQKLLMKEMQSDDQCPVVGALMKIGLTQGNRQLE